MQQRLFDFSMTTGCTCGLVLMTLFSCAPKRDIPLTVQAYSKESGQMLDKSLGTIRLHFPTDSLQVQNGEAAVISSIDTVGQIGILADFKGYEINEVFTSYSNPIRIPMEAVHPDFKSHRVVYLPFNGNLENRSGPSRLGGDPLKFDRGIEGSAAEFSGHGRVEVDSFKLPAEDITISFWAKVNRGLQNAVVATKPWGGANVMLLFPRSELCFWDFHGRRLTFEMKNFSSKDWHHYVFTHSRRGGMRVYIDGQRVRGQEDRTYFNPHSNYTLVVGGYISNRSDYRFSGLVDDFRVYTKEADESEVKQLADSHPKGQDR